MREVVLDTETTGLSPRDGHRIVEIGAVELVNHLPTGKTYHVYLDPERDMPKDAEAIHGLSNAFLKGKPLFSKIADEFLAFVAESALVIHNASFDMTFINAELSASSKPTIDMGQVIDTLAMAKSKFPTSPNSLDALCKRFGIDLSKRTKHGALLDSELLAEVYLELIGGRQTALGLVTPDSTIKKKSLQQTMRLRRRPSPLPSRLSDRERAAHAALVAELGDKNLWP